MKNPAEPYLGKFSDQVEHYHVLLDEAFESVINEGVSKYPVFIFHQQDVTVGIQIADRAQTAGDWSVNISTLEEFYIKGHVTIEQVEEIKSKILGKPPMYCCLVLSGNKGSLVFIPRSQDEH